MPTTVETPIGPTQTATEAAAEALRHAGRLDEAAAVLHAVLRDAPEAFGAHAGLGHIARARGDHAAALGHFRAALQLEPGHAGALAECGTDLLALAELDKAQSAFEAALRAAPSEFAALAGLGHVARRRGDRAAALAAFAAAAAAHPDNGDLAAEVATELRALGRLAEAGAIYERLAAGLDGNFDAQVSLGHLARARGDRTVALARFQQARALQPGHLGVLLEIVAELRDADRIAEARDLLGEVLAREPDNLAVLLQAAQCERLAGDRAAARALLRQALAWHPANVAVLVDCAIEERVAGEAEASADLLREALRLAPGDLHALLQSAEHARLADDPEAALEFCQEAMRLYPVHPAPHAQAARGLALLGRVEEGLAVLAAATALCGPHPEIVARYAELLRLLGRWDEARALLAGHPETATHVALWRQQAGLLLALGAFPACEAALAAAPAGSGHERAEVDLLRGELAAARWDFAGSVAALEQAIRGNPANGWAHWLAARASLARLDVAAARRHLAASVRLDHAAIRLRRQSPNVSQNLLGQVLDEFAADADLAERLRGLDAMPAGEARVEQALALVRGFPGKTAAAIGLVVALRLAGQLAGAAPRVQTAGPIPRRIAQYWDTADPPGDVLALMAGWRETHPDYVYTQFSDHEALAFLRAAYAGEVVQAYRRVRMPAQKADIFRLAWLYAEGGVYVDADDRCLAPVTPLLGGGAGLVAYQEEYGTLGNNFLAAAPWHKVIGRALEEAVAAVNRGDQDMPWLATGPGLLTRAFAEALGATLLQPAAFLAEVLVLERHDLLRVALPHATTAYKRSRKHWLRAAFGGAEAAAAP